MGQKIKFCNSNNSLISENHTSFFNITHFKTKRTILIIYICSLLAVFSLPLKAQENPILKDTLFVKSMGFPKVWKPYFSSLFAWDKREVDLERFVEINLGVYKDLMNPLAGVFGFEAEGYFRHGGGKNDGGFRLSTASKVLFSRWGYDYSLQYEHFNFLMSLRIPLRRGGLLGLGGAFRIDWFPGRKNSISLGLSVPINQHFMGKTRPKSNHVNLPYVIPVKKSNYIPALELHKTLINLQHAIFWINRFTIPFLDQSTKKGKSELQVFKENIYQFKNHIKFKTSLYPNGHNFKTEVNVYHQEFDKAFSLAAWNKTDRKYSNNEIAQKAKEIILNEVIFPYNRLLGQRKKNDSVLGYGLKASKIFKKWIQESTEIPTENYESVMYVFNQIISYIEESRAHSHKIWQDSRLVWIPLHYALRFEDHDTEDELDSIIELAVGQEFIEANDVHYIINELFQPELERMIKAAKDYHILWIHDYRGYNDKGEPDKNSYECTQVYLNSLIEKVKACDSTKNIPIYMIFLDQNYFEKTRGRLWLELLENPLGKTFKLPEKFKDWEDNINNLQEELRSAVNQSQFLQSGLKQNGNKWLYNKIKVQVNITNPSDLSFRSATVLKYFPFVPDNLMRDHRKVTFYDVTEKDPSLGEAMYTGMGIGEKYTAPSWDDRSILTRGPALVALKDAARELLIAQGFKEGEIPYPLKKFEKPANYDEMLEQLRAKGWTASAMQVHNVTGFGLKYATIVKAILYNLMPNGSHLYIPDSLWNGPFWGAMLVGASLRGCVVLVISPSIENAPSDKDPQMSRANELFTRFLIIQNELKEEIELAGGLFKIGIYNMDIDVNDVVGKVKRLHEKITQSEVFTRVFPFAPSVADLVGEMPDLLIAEGFASNYQTENKVKPKLHLKCQFFASQQTINTIIPIEEWRPLIQKYILARAKQVIHREKSLDPKELRKAIEKDRQNILLEWYKEVTPQQREKAIVYLTVGSHNQDYRSMIMDGEFLYVVGRAWAMIGYLDFISVIGQTTWVTELEELEKLLPRFSGFGKWLGRYLKMAI